jgi:flagellar biosynthesis chaperone FliJ
MSRPATRLTRLVELARLREEQARQTVAVARSAERAALAHVTASEEALRHPALTAISSPRFGSVLRHLGREALQRAEDGARRAGDAVEAEVDAWRATHQQLGTLERLDDRLHEAALAARRRREQHETDELATTRAGVHP